MLQKMNPEDEDCNGRQYDERRKERRESRRTQRPHHLKKDKKGLLFYRYAYSAAIKPHTVNPFCIPK
jgi:hypothetical protein